MFDEPGFPRGVEQVHVDDVRDVLRDALGTAEDPNNVAALNRILRQLESGPLQSLGRDCATAKPRKKVSTRKGTKATGTTLKSRSAKGRGKRAKAAGPASAAPTRRKKKAAIARKAKVVRNGRSVEAPPKLPARAEPPVEARAKR